MSAQTLSQAKSLKKQRKIEGSLLAILISYAINEDDKASMRYFYNDMVEEGFSHERIVANLSHSIYLRVS